MVSSLSCLTVGDWIQVATLIVVFGYTCITYMLWRQQKNQFQSAQRPWITPGDIYLEKGVVEPQFGIHLQNTGKLPALCKIQITRFMVKPSQVDKFIPLELIKGETSLAVFPYLSGVDSRFVYFIGLGGIPLFGDGTQFEIDLDIKYSEIGAPSSSIPYTYSATLEIPSFVKDKSKQTTMIRDSKAT